MEPTTYRIDKAGRPGVIFIDAYTYSQARQDCYELYGFWPEEHEMTQQTRTGNP